MPNLEIASSAFIVMYYLLKKQENLEADSSEGSHTPSDEEERKLPMKASSSNDTSVKRKHSISVPNNKNKAKRRRIISFDSKQVRLKQRRRVWVTDHYLNRSTADLSPKEEAQFKNVTCIAWKDFETLANLVEPKIKKSDTTFRKAVSVRKRLAVTLCFLETGASYISLQKRFRISKQLISKIIPNCCKAIVEVLDDYLQMPKSPEEWINVVEQFQNISKFTNCVGVLGARLIHLHAALRTGRMFPEDKSKVNFVLFTILDADHNFIYANTKSQERNSDGNLLKSFNLLSMFDQETLNLPEPKILPNRNKELPYTFVADENFSLSENIITPYVDVCPADAFKVKYNCQHRKVCRIAENTFGVVASVFRVLRKPLRVDSTSAKYIVMAIIYLHNFLRKSDDSQKIYNPTGIFDYEKDGELIEGSWRRTIVDEDIESFLPTKIISCPATPTTIEFRDEYTQYFANL